MKIKYILSFVIALILCCSQQIALAQAKKAWSCTIKEIDLLPGEKIVGYTYNVQSAYISSVPKIAKDWDMTVYNGTMENPPWFSSLNSRTEKFENAIPVSFFRDFVRVETIDSDKNSKPHDSVLTIYAARGSARRRKFTAQRHALEYAPVEIRESTGAISVSKLMDLKAQEKISCFDLKMVSAAVLALPHLPRGWNESISAHISSDGIRRGLVHGDMGTSTAALSAKEFRNLWVVEKLKSANNQAKPVTLSLTVGVADPGTTTVSRRIVIPITWSRD